MAMPPTMAEREAELAALQSAFDEYIASSRELEEELDAELAKMQEKLADSSAANAALSSQLENIAPQLASLEKALSESRTKLKEEQKLRRQAEQAQDELEAKYREAEGSLIALKEECDQVHEELAFKESELEETRLELEVERERHQVELEDAKADAALSSSLERDESQQAAKVASASSSAAASSVDEGYVKKLEDELELVTEQLIETEQRLAQTEDKLTEAESTYNKSKEAAEKSGASREEDAAIIKELQEENAQRLEDEHKLREELELTKEELLLTQEELKAVESDAKDIQGKFENLKEEFRKAGRGGEVAVFAAGLEHTAEDIAKLKDEIDNLQVALKNSKKDHEAVVEELEAVNERFDEAVSEAEKRGKEMGGSTIRAELKAEREEEIKELKEQLKKVAEENSALQSRVDDAEMSLAVAKDSQTRNAEGVEVQSELVKQLQSQLSRAKEDLAKKEKELEVLATKLEERVSKAEDNVSKLETELSATKGKLAEAEAGLIVFKREKEEAELKKKPRRSEDSSRTYRSTGSIDHPDLMYMDEEQKVTRSRKTRSNSPDSYKRLEIKLAEETKKLKELQDEHDKLKDQKRMSEVHAKRLEEDIKVLQRQLFASGETGVSTSMNRLSSMAQQGGGDLDMDAKSKVDEVIESGDPALMKAELKTLEKKINAQRDYNNQLLSKMLQLQGNIQVFCRIRPMGIDEIQKGYKVGVEALSETELGCYDNRTNKWKPFNFDRVWGPDHSQQSIFQDVEPIALSVVDGFNACIFAYGQTGSGKTYTMEGVEKNNQRGISYRTIQKVFHLLNLKQQQTKTNAILFRSQEQDDEEKKPENFVYEIEIGMLEIYNDECYDLLGSSGASLAEKKKDAQKSGGKASLEIRRNKEGRIEVPNLTKEKVESIEDVIELLKKGNTNRATAATSLNSTSSRSHMVLMVDVNAGMEGQPGNKGTLFLVDLAGSERVKNSEVEGDHLKEAGHINKSLSALGNVMEALDRKASHVPYRDSKLTYLLQDALGGNSRTMMVVAVTPADIAYDESVHALQFATRVRRIQIGAAQRNVTSKNLEETVKELTAEMKKMASQKANTERQLSSMKKDNDRVQAKLQSISSRSKAQASDSKTLEVLRKNNNEMANRWQKEKTLREQTTEELEQARTQLEKAKRIAAKASREQESLQAKLDEKEALLQKRTAELRDAKSASNAANLRARKAQVLGNRRPSSTPSAPSKPSTPSARTARSTGSGTTPSGSAASVSASTGTSAASTSLASEDVSEIRAKVLDLLEKHDKGKVNRIDIIMEKFKGKESLLLEKMTQRYEGGGEEEDDSGKTRSELAAERHIEKMRKLREGN